MEIHTEFYDPIVLEAGESIYLDSSMGHAYVAADGCDEASVLGVCSSADEGLMESLMELHVDSTTERMPAAETARLPSPTRDKRRRKTTTRTGAKKTSDGR